MRPPKPRSLDMAALLLAAVLAAPAVAADAVKPALNPDNGEALLTELERGRQALAHRDVRGALDAFKKADRMADGHSADALDGLAVAYAQSGHLGDGIKAARRGVEAAKTPEVQARLDNRLGFALYQKFQAEQDKRALEESISWFRKALEVFPGSASVVRYNLGIALLAQSRDEEGVAALKTFVESQPDNPRVENAKRLIADPRRARELFSPDFSVVTLEGQPLSLDDLKGKVVLIDFWATWCGPCRASSPALKRLADKMKQKPFVLFGISVDHDGAKLRDYLAREKEGWPQFWDQSGQMTRLFNVSSFPTFLVLDGEGRVVYSGHGWGGSTERQLLTAVNRAVDRLASAAPANGGKS